MNVVWFAISTWLCHHYKVGMVTKPSTEQTQDFSIHNEDFPALPGPNYKDATLNNDESKPVSSNQIWLYSTFWEYVYCVCTGLVDIKDI